MVIFLVLSQRNLAYCSRGSAPKPQRLSELRTLDFSLRSFSHSDPLFSITSALFLRNTRGGIPRPELIRCTEAQKRLSISPLLATHTQTPGMGVSRLLQFPLQCWQLQFCSHFVFIAIQIPFPANPFFLHPSKSWGVSPLRTLCSALGGLCVKSLPFRSKLSVARLLRNARKSSSPVAPCLRLFAKGGSLLPPARPNALSVTEITYITRTHT